MISILAIGFVTEVVSDRQASESRYRGYEMMPLKKRYQVIQPG
jgi:hypothetical protein